MKALNSGIRGGLWEEKHRRAMGDAIWLFGKLVHWQTTPKGLVLRGKPLSYGKSKIESARSICEHTGYSERLVRRWMAKLRRTGYITVKHTVFNLMVIYINNPKKFGTKQLSFPQGFAQPISPLAVETAPGIGRIKEGTEIEQKEIKPNFSPFDVLQKNLHQAQREYVRTNGGNGSRRAVDEAYGALRAAERAALAPVAARKAMA